MNNTAIRASVKDCTLFSYGGKEIRFRAPRSLKRYLRINKWNAEGLADIESSASPTAVIGRFSEDARNW